MKDASPLRPAGLPASVRHVVWDWNGTLLDDVHLCVETINRLLGARRLPLVTLESYRELFDFPVKTYYGRIGFDFDREPFEVVGAEFMDYYEQEKKACALRPGVVQALDAIRAAGVPQSVLSAYQHRLLEEVLRYHGLRDYFTHVCGIGDIYAAGKLEQGRQLIARLGLDPQAVLLIGDTLHDAEIAAALGCQCLLLAGGHQSRTRLDRAGVPILAGPSGLSRPLNPSRRE